MSDRSAEGFFRESEYWRAWSTVPNVTADIPYALAAVRPVHRSVLDAPCGRGRLLAAIAARRPDLRVVGVDVNDDMVQQARGAAPGAAVMRASIYALPFDDKVFDLVLCHQSFMHFEHAAAALAELTRVARLDVYLSVTTRRQLNTALRRLGVLGPSGVPHWQYDVEDLEGLLPDDFAWRVTGAFLLGAKLLHLSHEHHLALHRAIGRHLPQWLLRRYGQTLFIYGRRRGAETKQ